MSVSAPPVLWHIEISHYNEKARWALDFKGVAHVRRTPQPGFHSITAKRLSGGRTLPVLELDGAAIGDSTSIIAALEDRYPDPALYPADPEQRRRALEIEDFFDEQVAPAVRRLVFFHVLRAPGARQTMADISPGGAIRARLLRAAYPLLRLGVAATYGAHEQRMDAALESIRAGVARVESEAGASGHLVGDSFSVADLSAAALLAPLARPAEYGYPLPPYPPPLEALREQLEGPAFDWVRDIYSRHRPASAEIPA